MGPAGLEPRAALPAATEGLVLRIGGLAFVATAAGDEPVEADPDPAYQAFHVRSPEPQDDVIPVRIRRGETSAPRGADVAFDAGASWRALRLPNGDHAVLYAPGLEGGPAWRAVFDDAVTHVEIDCSDHLLYQGRLTCPLRYPLDQLLVGRRLSWSGGSVVHCLMAAIEGRAVLFPGVSGAGKTTLARILAPAEGVAVLSDDRAVVRRAADGGWRAWGTPWPGEGGHASPDEVKLAAVAFLEKGAANGVRSITAGEAFRRLVKVASVHLYDREATARTLDGLAALCAGVPASVLTFRPEASVVTTVRRLFG